jgi:CRP-like cAMP-binding protein
MASDLDTMSRNRLLKALPLDLAKSVSLDLSGISLKQPQLIVERGAIIEFIYFPTTCLISMVVDLHNGNTVEALTVGSDGFVETAAFFGKPNSTFKGLVQISGDALRMRIEDFRTHLEDTRFRECLGTYVEDAMSMLAQSSACLAFHPVEQRLARWLLEVEDRVNSDELGLTQEFLSQMMGVQRPTASIAVRMLVTADLISHRRGAVRIMDRARLEEAACECYRTARERLDVQER